MRRISSVGRVGAGSSHFGESSSCSSFLPPLYILLSFCPPRSPINPLAALVNFFFCQTVQRGRWVGSPSRPSHRRWSSRFIVTMCLVRHFFPYSVLHVSETFSSLFHFSYIPGNAIANSNWRWSKIKRGCNTSTQVCALNDVSVVHPFPRQIPTSLPFALSLPQTARPFLHFSGADFPMLALLLQPPRHRSLWTNILSW